MSIYREIIQHHSECLAVQKVYAPHLCNCQVSLDKVKEELARRTPEAIAQAGRLTVTGGAAAPRIDMSRASKEEAEIELLRLQLAACSTAALQNTPEARLGRISHQHPYSSTAYQDVCNAVDREIELRAQLDECRRDDMSRASKDEIEIERLNKKIADISAKRITIPLHEWEAHEAILMSKIESLQAQLDECRRERNAGDKLLASFAEFVRGLDLLP